MLRQEVEIRNKLGMHARAAAKFVTLAQTFQSDITIITNGRTVNGKSIMGIMMLAASKGTFIEIITEGEDESSAMRHLIELVANKFDETD